MLSPKTSFASSLVNIEQAERFISAGLKANRWKLIYWAAAKSESIPELAGWHCSQLWIQAGECDGFKCLRREDCFASKGV